MRAMRLHQEWVRLDNRRKPQFSDAFRCVSVKRFRIISVLLMCLLAGFYFIIVRSELRTKSLPSHSRVNQHTWRPTEYSNVRPQALPSAGCELHVREAHIPGLTFACEDAIALHPNMSRPEARDRYYKHMLSKHATCQHPELLGRKSDGGWWACREEPFFFVKPCLVYSFGIRDDWSFDEAVSNKYGCEVHSFDPSINMSDHKHSELVYFHNTGLGGTNEVNEQGWKMRSFCTLLKELGHNNRTVDYLKFDVEFSEWPSLAAMLAEGCLPRVKQLGFEVHSWADTVEYYDLYWRDLQGLLNLGFQKWRLHNRNWRCFAPSDETQLKKRCPQTDMNFFNINYIPNLSKIKVGAVDSQTTRR